MKTFRIFGLVLIAFLLATGSAFATKGTVGLGVGSAPDYEGSEDNETVPMLMFNHRYDSGRFVSLMGTNLRVNLLADKQFSVGPVLNYRQGRDDVDNDRVDAMRDIDDALELGIFTGFDVKNMLLGLEMLVDVSDEHDGYTIQGTAGYRWHATPDLAITPLAFLTYADSDYMKTYFSVTPSNRGSSGLPNYSASSGLKDVGIKLSGHYTPWENWGIMGVFSFKTLLDEAEDSPVVKEGDDKQMFFGVMGTYRWESK